MSLRPVLLAVPVVGVLALGSAVAAVTATSGDDTVVGGGSTTSPATAGSCADLLTRYVERGLAEVGPWGWSGPVPAYLEDSERGDSGALAAPLAPPQATTVRQTSEPSGTTVQESGVDEADSVKTDGSVLYRVDGGRLTTDDVAGPAVVHLASVELPRMRDAEILLTGTTVVAVAPGDDGVTTRTAVLDVSDPAQPRVDHTATYDAALVSARLHGTGDDATVRLVLRSGPPDLPFVAPGEGGGGLLGLFEGGEDDAERSNRDVVRASTLDDWLPHVAVDGGEEQRLLGCEDVRVPDVLDDEPGLGTVSVVGLDVADPTTTSATGLAVDTDIAYESADRLYLATSAATASWSECFDVCPTAPTLRTTGRPDDGTTHLHAFALSGREATYVASGEVDGVVRDRWSIDEHDGVLRLAVGPSVRTGPDNAVVTVVEDGDDLVEQARLDGLGPDETIRSVRWSDSLAVVVTFRETDPLYAVDLTDQARPTLLGELEIPGFSSYLHPLGGHRMVGIGEGPGPDGWGAQLGLFDVTDLTHPRRLGVTHYGYDTWAAASVDPRQLTWLPEARTVLTVVEDWSSSGSSTGWVSIVRLGGGAMTNEMVPLERGGDVTDVRLVPLPDGRVVLAGNGDASFLDL